MTKKERKFLYVFYVLIGKIEARESNQLKLFGNN